MIKLYNIQSDIVNNFRDYFSNFTNSKTLLNFLHELFVLLLTLNRLLIQKLL